MLLKSFNDTTIYIKKLKKNIMINTVRTHYLPGKITHKYVLIIYETEYTD